MIVITIVTIYHHSNALSGIENIENIEKLI